MTETKKTTATKTAAKKAAPAQKATAKTAAAKTPVASVKLSGATYATGKRKDSVARVYLFFSTPHAAIHCPFHLLL